jgi:hypothetical protein
MSKILHFLDNRLTDGTGHALLPRKIFGYSFLLETKSIPDLSLILELEL